MSEDKAIETDEATGNTIACLQFPQIFCAPLGQNTTYTHTACLDGGTYTYALSWGDTSGDITEVGVTLADGETQEYTHVYETEGIYSASFKVEVSFPNDSVLSNEEMRMWEINNETCTSHSTEAPTISLAPSVAPTTATSAASSANAHSLLLLAISAIYLFKRS